MAKDPAVLFYIANWLTSTAAMDADARGWYLNLILHNYDKEGLPNDVEILAQLASVKHSEYERFKQVLEQVLKQKFILNEETGLLENPKAMEMLEARSEFKEKRQRSGNIGVVIKTAKSITGYTKKALDLLKEDLFKMSDEEVCEAKSEQVLKQMLKLYINTNKDISIDNNKSIKDIAEQAFLNLNCTYSSDFKNLFFKLLKTKNWCKKPLTTVEFNLKRLLKFEEEFAVSLIEASIAGEYKGVVFPDTEKHYQNYLNQKNGIKNNRDTAIESRRNMVELATAVLTGNKA